MCKCTKENIRPWPSPVHWQRTIEEPIGDTVGRRSIRSPGAPFHATAVATSDGGGGGGGSVTSRRKKRFRVERSGMAAAIADDFFFPRRHGVLYTQRIGDGTRHDDRLP